MKRLVIAGFVATVCQISFAASITAVETKPFSADSYQLVFKNAGVVPKAFNTSTPPSIVLDFPNTTNSLKNKDVPVGAQGIYNVSVLSQDKNTRAVINLSRPTQYNYELRGKDLVLTVGAAPVFEQTVVSHSSVNPAVPAGAKRVKLNAASAPAAAQKTKVVSKDAGYAHVSSNNVVDFSAPSAKLNLNPMFRLNKTKDGGVFSFNRPSKDTTVKVKQSGNRVIAEFNGYQVPANEQRRLEVSDYGSPVEYVDITRTSKGTRFELGMGNNAFEYLASNESDTLFRIEVKKPAKTAVEREAQERMGFTEGKRYEGEPLSLNFQDIEVRAVLQIIAEFTQNNIVVSDSVTGNITLRLDNVPWDQALDIILKTKSLDKRINGNVIYVAPQQELGNAEIGALEIAKRHQELVPTISEIIEINYASVEDIKKIIESSRHRAGNDQFSQDALLSSRGSITIDPRTNNLIVNDRPDRIEAVRKMIRSLDEPVKQVLVDTRLVLTRDSYTRSLGARLGLSFINTGSNASLAGSGSGEAAAALTKSMAESTAQRTTLTPPDLSSRLGVSLPATGAAGRYGLAILSKDFLVDLELTALQTEGQVEVVSSPRVVTQDNMPASISSGITVPIVENKDGKSSVKEVNAELKVEVTPRITPEDMVDLKLVISDNSIGDSVPVAGAQQFSIATNNLQTNVLVDNGETIVLGGVYKQEQRAGETKVPFLGDLPIVGNAFKTRTRTFDKSELLFFVTPRVIDQKLSRQDKFSNLRN